MKRQITFYEYKTCPRWDFLLVLHFVFLTVHHDPLGTVEKKLQDWWVKNTAKYIHPMSSLFCSYLVLPDLQRNNHTCSRPNLCWSISWGGLCGYRHSVYSTKETMWLGLLFIHALFLLCLFLVFWSPWSQWSREDHNVQDVDWRHWCHLWRGHSRWSLVSKFVFTNRKLSKWNLENILRL